MNLKLMATKTCSPIFLIFKTKFNLNRFCISFLVNPSTKLSNETLQKSVKNVLMESVKEDHRSVTVKQIGKAAVGSVWIRDFLKENNLTTVKNIFIIADPCNINKYKRKFKKL